MAVGEMAVSRLSGCTVVEVDVEEAQHLQLQYPPVLEPTRAGMYLSRNHTPNKSFVDGSRPGMHFRVSLRTWRGQVVAGNSVKDGASTEADKTSFSKSHMPACVASSIVLMFQRIRHERALLAEFEPDIGVWLKCAELIKSGSETRADKFCGAHFAVPAPHTNNVVRQPLVAIDEVLTNLLNLCDIALNFSIIVSP